jgi:hypothetical protein
LPPDAFITWPTNHPINPASLWLRHLVRIGGDDRRLPIMPRQNAFFDIAIAAEALHFHKGIDLARQT